MSMRTTQDRDASNPGCQQAFESTRQDEKLSTRITEGTARRLRLYVALRDHRIAAVVEAALDQYLPTRDELAVELAETVAPAASTPKENHR
jgi:hypothetical protein